MTQLMLFDSYTVPSPVPVSLTPVTNSAPTPVAESITAGGSIPLYDPKQGEIHRFGDLAQLVIARYEIVAKRREIIRRRRLATG